MKMGLEVWRPPIYFSHSLIQESYFTSGQNKSSNILYPSSSAALYPIGPQFWASVSNGNAASIIIISSEIHPSGMPILFHIINLPPHVILRASQRQEAPSHGQTNAKKCQLHGICDFHDRIDIVYPRAPKGTCSTGATGRWPPVLD